MAKNRYIGEYPVIGIRPIIDGRRGPMQLRESLEDQVTVAFVCYHDSDCLFAFI